jgi:hypothetical protein
MVVNVCQMVKAVPHVYVYRAIRDPDVNLPRRVPRIRVRTAEIVFQLATAIDVTVHQAFLVSIVNQVWEKTLIQ